MKASDLYNPLVKTILKSPLHGVMSDDTMLLTFTGRKSGQTYSTPINYALDGNRVTLITNRKHGWWKNFEQDAPVTVQLRGQERCGVAHLVPADAGALIGAMIDVYHGISYEQAAKLSPKVVLIRIQLN